MNRTSGTFLYRFRKAGVCLFRACSIALFAIFAALPAFAQEAGGDLSESPSGWIFRWLNFAIVFGAIAYCAVKYGTPYFRGRAEQISEQIAEGARAREAAERHRQAALQKLAGVSAEVAQIRADAKRSGEVEAQRLRALARGEAEMIAKAAQAEIAAAQRAARLELKGLAARLAIEQSESLLREAISPSVQAGLFEGFVIDLERGAN